VEVWPVMRCTNFWKHTDDDPKEARDFRHGLLYIVVGDSRRANVPLQPRRLRIAPAAAGCKRC
jgi:hypothetical protein